MLHPAAVPGRLLLWMGTPVPLPHYLLPWQHKHSSQPSGAHTAMGTLLRAWLGPGGSRKHRAESSVPGPGPWPCPVEVPGSTRGTNEGLQCPGAPDRQCCPRGGWLTPRKPRGLQGQGPDLALPVPGPLPSAVWRPGCLEVEEVPPLSTILARSCLKVACKAGALRRPRHREEESVEDRGLEEATGRDPCPVRPVPFHHTVWTQRLRAACTSQIPMNRKQHDHNGVIGEGWGLSGNR